VHPLDNRIGSNDKAPPGATIDKRRVIQKVEPTRSGERREESSDALKLVDGLPGHVSGRDD
jgi:hypothetical protein